MNIVGDDFLRASIAQDGYFLKVVLNARAAHFFPHTVEHRDATLPGLCYRDDSNGNALGSTIKPTRMDIRLQPHFSPSQVKAIIDQMEIEMDSWPMHNLSKYTMAKILDDDQMEQVGLS